jgi:hypothetical protein
LLAAQISISATCVGKKHFFVDGYKGTINTTLLEADLAATFDVHVLAERTTLMCRNRLVGDDERGFCMTDLSSKWNVVDVIRSDGMLGLDWLLSSTKSPRKVAAGMHRERQGLVAGLKATVTGEMSADLVQKKDPRLVIGVR